MNTSSKEEAGVVLRSDEPSARINIGLVGGGNAGTALFGVLLDWPQGKLVVVIDPREEAPALGRARTLGIPTAAHHLEVFTYPVDLVLEATGKPDVLEDLLRAKPPGVEVIGASSLRFFWDLLQDKVKATHQLITQIDMTLALGSSLDVTQQLAIVTRKLAQACEVDRCGILIWDEATGLVTPVMSQFSTGEPNERMWKAFKGLGKLKLPEIPLLYEVMERRGPLEIDDPASNPLVPVGWTDVFEIKSLLAVPIFRKNRVVGACILDYWREPRPFKPDQAALAMALAGQVSLAFENARLFQRAEERARKLTALSHLTRLITSAHESREVFHAVAEAATTLLGAKMARVWVDDPASRTLRAEAQYGLAPDFQKLITEFSAIPFAGGVVGRVFAAKAPDYVSDIQQDRRWLNQRLAKEAGLHSCAAIPLITGERVVGVLAILFGDRRRFTDEEKEAMGLLADHAAIAIQNARLFSESEGRRHAAEALAEIGRDLSRTLDLNVVGQRVADSLRALLGADTSTLYRVVPESRDLVSLAFSGVGWSSGEKLVFPPGTGLVGLAARERCPVVATDLLADPRITLTPEAQARLEQTGLRAALALPLIVEDRQIGAIFVGTRAERTFDDGEIRLAQAFADQAALALENARLYEEAERRRREAEVIARLAGDINASLDLDAILQRVAEGGRELCGSDMAKIALREPGTEGLVFRYLVGARHQGYDTFRIEAGRGSGGQVLLTGHPFRTDHYAEDPRITKEYIAVALEEGIVAELVVPIRSRDRVEGLLFVQNRSPRPFTDRDEAILARLADHAAIAIRNVELLEELRNRQVRIEGLLEVSRQLAKIQPLRSLLDSIAETCGRLLGTDSVGFRLAEGDDLVVAGTYGDAREVMSTPRLKIGESLSGIVAATGKPLVVDDPANDPRLIPAHRETIRKLGHRASLMVPVKTGERVLGVLSIQTRRQEGFSVEDLAIATAFGSHVAVALKNSRLYGELRAALEKVEASQQQLVKTERLRALGEMAAGVAHDFNNLLAVILGRAELLLTHAREPELVRGLQTLRQAALDGAQTVRRIQEFTRTRRTRLFGRVNLRELLLEVVELNRPRWKDEPESRGVRYEVRVGGEPVPPVAGIAEELREVFSNLLTNALEAMPAGGRLIFRVAADSQHVTVTAADTGSGMSEETRRRVFEPFFTTKGPRGTGLGLAVTWGIVTRHGGTIEAESRLGVGSTFTVQLPIGQPIPSEEKPGPAPQPPQPAQVLVIDDQPEVRAVLGELLSAQGYAVTEAAEGAEGLARCEAGPVDLVLTDISMPGMSGWEVAACRARFPRLPVALITGWGDQLDPDKLTRHQISFVLAKPFVTSDVLRLVSQALSAPHGTRGNSAIRESAGPSHGHTDGRARLAQTRG